MKGLFADRSFGFKMLLLLLFAVFFGSLFQLFGAGLAAYLNGDLDELLSMFERGTLVSIDFNDRKALRALQFFSTSGLFLIGPGVYAYLAFREPARALGLGAPTAWISLGLAVSGTLCFSPLIDQLVQGSQALIDWWIPSSWAGRFHGMMDTSEQTIEALIASEHWTERIETLIVVACLPAMAEELLFRGVVQTELLRAGLRPVWALTGVALLFALVHAQPYHVLPLFVFGLFLGWMRWKSGNLWYSISVHFANNALVLWGMWYTEPPTSTEPEWALVDLGLAVLWATLGAALLWGFARSLRTTV
ncbi:CPBP family intramembrane metalloprotease [bacterium]|nr:CPBP family intramembrane metalloprotease [bacterium]